MRRKIIVFKVLIYVAALFSDWYGLSRPRWRDF
jgi:hypothetical protein